MGMFLHLFIPNETKKEPHKTLIKFIALPLFNVNYSNFLNMYYVFPLLKDKEKLNICNQFKPFKQQPRNLRLWREKKEEEKRKVAKLQKTFILI